jgi:FMN-dependent NADH-azoreductase
MWNFSVRYRVKLWLLDFGLRSKSFQFSEENIMSTLLIVVLVVLLLGGGGYYGRGRYW